MAFDNIPFMEARNLVESRQRSTPSFTAKDQRNFPTLPSKDPNGVEHNESKQPQFSQVEVASFKEVLLKGSKGNPKLPLQDIFDAILTVPEAEVLCERIKKCIDLHVANVNLKDKNDDSK